MSSAAPMYKRKNTSPAVTATSPAPSCEVAPSCDSKSSSQKRSRKTLKQKLALRGKTYTEKSFLPSISEEPSCNSDSDSTQPSSVENSESSSEEEVREAYAAPHKAHHHAKGMTNNKPTSKVWKQKVKTELCKYWLAGQECENLSKDQGCGFAHGNDELQRRKGLNTKYLTTVCNNYLVGKCSYGPRCIFQHPEFNVQERQ